MDKLDGLLEAATANNAYPGTAATIVDSKGNRLYHKAFGVNDISAEHPTKFTTDTQMLIFSCTKLVACIAALQLVEQGKLSLDDPVSKYIGDIVDIPVFVGDGTTATRPQRTTMTIQHLFSHTAGFTYVSFRAHCPNTTNNVRTSSRRPRCNGGSSKAPSPVYTCRKEIGMSSFRKPEPADSEEIV
jgi:CubicO group peptidase (beta-lactamase class C family)